MSTERGRGRGEDEDRERTRTRTEWNHHMSSDKEPHAAELSISNVLVWDEAAEKNNI